MNASPDRAPKDGGPTRPQPNVAQLATLLATTPSGDPAEALTQWFAGSVGVDAVVLRPRGARLRPVAASAARPADVATVKARLRSAVVDRSAIDALAPTDEPALTAVRGALAALLGVADGTDALVTRLGDRDRDDLLIVLPRAPESAGEPATPTDLVAVARDAAAWVGLLGRERASRQAAELIAEEAETGLAVRGTELAEARATLDRVELALGHEVREMLRTVHGWTRLALARDLDDTIRGELVRKAGRWTERAAASVGDVLEVLGDEAATRRDREQVDLLGVAGWVRDVLDDRVRAANARIVTGPLPTVEGSPSSLRRILFELVANAVEHGGRFVEVVVHAHVDAAGTLRLSVQDNGDGLSPESLPLAFDPGFRTGRGAGYGLTRVQETVMALGGEIRLSSPEPGGCRVEVAVPGGRSATRSAPEPSPLPGA